MKKYILVTLGTVIGLSSGLKAEYESPGAGPNLNTLIGGTEDQSWAFWIRTFAGHNDNVQFVPDGVFFSGDQESAYIGVTAQGSMRLTQNGDYSVGVAFRYDHVHYFEDSGGVAAPDNFDLTVFEPAIYLNYSNDSWYGRATYSFRWEDAKTTLIGVASHNLKLMAGKEINPCLKAELAWTHGWDEFHTRATGIFDRDAERDRVSLSFIHKAGPGSPKYILRYAHLDNDADGSNFRYDGYEVMFRVEKAITNNVGVAAYVSYAELDYSTGPRSDLDLVQAGIRFVYVISENWSADLYYDYLDVDTGVLGIDGSQNDIGIGLRYDF